jgi:tetratricopeptide (TPR) repeat protein
MRSRRGRHPDIKPMTPSQTRQRRRRRRLALIGLVLLLIVGGVTLRYLVVKDRDPVAAQQDQARMAGLEAAAAGRHEAAIDALSPYADKHPDDVEVVAALADAHERLSARDPQQILPTVQRLRQLIELDGSRVEAMRRLLALYQQFPVGVEQPTLELAERILRLQPGDLDALRAKADAFGRLSRLDDALETLDALLEQRPLDVSALLARLNLLVQQGQPTPVLLEATRQLRDQHPEAAEAMLIEAHARLLDDDPEAAMNWVQRATQPPPPGADFVRAVVQLYDRAGRYPETLTYLESLRESGSEHTPTAELARRRFENGDLQSALDLLAEVESPMLNLRVLAAIAHLRLGQVEPALAQVKQIESVGGAGHEAVAQLLWRAAENDGSPAGVVRADRAVRAAGVRDPYLDLLVAPAYARTQQLAAARQRYESAFAQRPAWAAPALGLAEQLIDGNQPREAARFAMAAVQRQPEALAPRIVLADALAAEPQRLSDRQRDEILRLIDRVQQASPGEPRTLVVRVALLAATDQPAEASAAARDTLKLGEQLSESSLLRLLQVTEQHGLDAQSEVQAAYTDRFGQTLRITMLRAQRLIAEGRAADAVARFDAASPAEPDAAWQSNRALLLERVGSPQATAAWAAAADAHPQSVAIQQAALASPAVWRDPALVQRCIDRLRQALGDDAPAWREQQARLWLSSPEPAAKAADVTQLLEDLPPTASTLLLQAAAQRYQDKPGEAAVLLQQALTLEPGNIDITLDLAAVQRSRGQRDRATALLRSLAPREDLTTSQRRRALQVWIALGETPRAVQMLENLQANGNATPADLLTLAQLYRAQGRDADALALAQGILQRPTGAGVAFVADLQAAAGQPDAAAATLDLLNATALPAAEQKTIRAAHLAVHGGADQAEAAFRTVVEQNPAEASGWRNLAAFQLRSGQIAEAVDTAAKGAARVPADEGLRALADRGEQVRSAVDRPGVAAMALALLTDEQHRGAAGETLDLLTDSTATENADAIVRLADRHASFEELQLLSITSLIRGGDLQAAVSRAEQVRGRFVDSPRAARLSAETWAAVGRWPEALDAAEGWRRRLRGDPRPADLLIARAQRELGRPRVALQRLEPYRRSLTANPMADPAATQQLVLTLAAAGEADAGLDLLGPLLPQDPYWRAAGIDAAVRLIARTEAAGDWLAAVEQALPASDGIETAAVAQAWWAVGRRDSYRPYLDRGRSLAEQLAEGEGASAALWFFLGTVYEQDRDLAAAERAYRQTLELAPEQPGAMNNLAMVLADAGGDLDEALQLIDRVLQTLPDDPNLLDTRAHVLIRMGRLGEAETAVRRAMQLDPRNAAWAERLGQISDAQSAVD